MQNSSNFQQVWQKVCQVLLNIKDGVCFFVSGVGHFFKIIGSYAFRLRKILLSIPVVVAAVSLASYCRERMPEIVGVGLQENGAYAATISRDLAVLGPLAITGICLLLMFCSRKTLYPWLISIFSLVLPILLMATNMIFLPF